MNMNNVDVSTKDVLILVNLSLAGYDFDHLENFDVTVETGSEMKVLHIDVMKQRRHGVKQRGYYPIYYSSLNAFTLDDLKITCKYPVAVICDKFIINKHIYPKEELEGKTTL